jgi:poly-gamma-glutamate synthesis protein (capsule biosynthesis protein)
MGGDVLLHEGLWATARADARAAGGDGLDFTAVLAGLRPVVAEADLAICHLETPLGPPGGPFSGYPLFSVPPQVVPGLRATGFDLCTTASNHSVDQGFDGLRRTLDTLDRVGMAHAGTSRSAREDAAPDIVPVDGARVAVVSQTYGTNGMPVAEPWSVRLIDVPDILDRAARARRTGADIVLVALHWGLEYQSEPTPEQRATAAQLLASPDVDLVYGHHAHVVQPFERLGRKWVAYGLGNMIAQQSTQVTGVYEGALARFTLVRRPGGRFRVVRAEYVPTYITSYDEGSPDMRVLSIPAALPRGTSQATPGELRAALRRTSAAVNLLDARDDGLRRAG